MNIYRCISETMYTVIPILDDGTGPSEPWAVAELVAAETRGKAKYLAATSDQHLRSDIIYNMVNMPKFSIVCTRKNVNLPVGIIAKPRPAWWRTRAEICAAWRNEHPSVMVS